MLRTAIHIAMREAGHFQSEVDLLVLGLLPKLAALVESLPKPTGFFDPKNPYDLPAAALVKKGEKPPA